MSRIITKFRGYMKDETSYWDDIVLIKLDVYSKNVLMHLYVQGDEIKGWGCEVIHIQILYGLYNPFNYRGEGSMLITH